MHLDIILQSLVTLQSLDSAVNFIPWYLLDMSHARLYSSKSSGSFHRWIVVNMILYIRQMCTRKLMSFNQASNSCHDTDGCVGAELHTLYVMMFIPKNVQVIWNNDVNNTIIIENNRSCIIISCQGILVIGILLIEISWVGWWRKPVKRLNTKVKLALHGSFDHRPDNNGWITMQLVTLCRLAEKCPSTIYF